MVITRKESNLDPSLPDKYLRHSQIIGCTANLLLCPVPQAKCSARASLLFRSLKSIQISGTDMYFMENWPEIRASPPTPFLGNARKQTSNFLWGLPVVPPAHREARECAWASRFEDRIPGKLGYQQAGHGAGRISKSQPNVVVFHTAGVQGHAGLDSAFYSKSN